MEIGHLEQVNPRELWAHEDGDFTPWLAREENLALIGKTIGHRSLTLVAKERPVGLFRADILAKDTFTNDLIVIENQLERSDHSHLGQLLTYAHNLKASACVWIATSFTEEHKIVLDCLNELTESANIKFYGVKVELWRIGNSPIAPQFTLISKPRDYQQTTAQIAHVAIILTGVLLDLEYQGQLETQKQRLHETLAKSNWINDLLNAQREQQ
jgi:hypothetical protein